MPLIAGKKSDQPIQQAPLFERIQDWIFKLDVGAGLNWFRFGLFCLIALLIGMFTANVNATLKGVTLRGKPATPLWLRTPMQAFFIWLLWWSSRG